MFLSLLPLLLVLLFLKINVLLLNIGLREERQVEVTVGASHQERSKFFE